MPTARIVESYTYGQIHFNGLDYEEDAFTSSREGIVNDNPKFNDFLQEIKRVFNEVISDWDILRRDHGKDGDPENTQSITPRERKAEELFNVTSKELLPSDTSSEVETWVIMLRKEAHFNIPSYTECFISENLIREYILHNNINLTNKNKKIADKWREKAHKAKQEAGISFQVRQNKKDYQYLDMFDLANMVDKPKNYNEEASISRDAKKYKPIRDAVAHTSLITDDAKQMLSLVFVNIKARLKILLKSKENNTDSDAHLQI